MRILVVSAYYPPHHIGGYELGCRDVVHQLRARGHEVQVLTSDFHHPENTLPEETQVLRLLHRHAASRRFDKKAETRTFVRVARQFRPTIVYFWSQSELCFWFAAAARRIGYPIAFFLSDTSFSAWRTGAWLGGLARRNRLIHAIFGRTVLVQGRPIISGQACHFASQFLRRFAASSGIEIDELHSIVAHWGIEPSEFDTGAREQRNTQRLLYVGQLIPQKGIHTAISALGILAGESDALDLSFTIVGGGLDDKYQQRLREMTVQLGIADRVNFMGRIPRASLRQIYAEHDALLFTSEWDEPFAITPLEAMAAAVAVVGTTTGGSGELLRDRETALTFVAGDARDCARAIRELCVNPTLRDRIQQAARHEVINNYTLAKMVARIEQSLEALAE